MSSQTTIQKEPPKLSKHLFWDKNVAKIDWEKHAHEVIARTVMYGNLKEWFEIKRFYGLEKIKREMLKVRYLDKKTLYFLSTYFNIPKEEFRCYIWRQSIPTHSPF